MSSTVSDEASSRATGVKRDWRLLHVDDAGSRTYESKGPDHEAMLIVDRDGRRAVHEIAMCGYCLGGRCEFHPDGPQGDVFGPVYPSDLLAERQASTPVTGSPDGAAPPEAVQDIVEAQAPVPASEVPALVPELPPVPTVPPEVEQAARALAFQVRSRGVMHRNRFSHSPEGLDYAVAMDWVVLDDDQVRPGAVNPEPMTALPDERSSRGWASRVFSRT